jgi:hypothetical protein
MKVQPIIDRLKAVSTTLGGRIAGAAEFSAEVEAARLSLPCAFVLRASGEASEAATLGAVVQMLTEDFAIVVAVDASADGRGQAAAEALDDVMADLIAGLLGWSPDATHNAFEYVRDDHVAIDRARLWHQFTFRTSGAISSL